MTGRMWVLDLGHHRPASLNDRVHWSERARGARWWRQVTWAVCRAAGVPPLGRASVELHVTPPDRRRRDQDNLVATLKPVLDGLVDAGVVPDDTPEHVEYGVPRLREPDGTRRWSWLLLIRDATPPADGGAA